MRFLLHSALVVAVIVALFTPADAVVFLTGGKWPAAADGLVRIKVCVHADTKVDQKRKSTLVHDRNPTRDEVIARIRAALAGSWERVSAVRFEGWQPCGPSEPTSTVVLKLHPDVNARAKLGYSAVTEGSLYPDANIDIEFKPWGTHGGAREACLGYDVGKSLEIIDEARTIRPNLIARVVITRRRATAIGKNARNDLAAVGVPLMPVELAERVAYQQAMGEGRGVTNMSGQPDATREIRDLTTAIDNLTSEHLNDAVTVAHVA